MAQILDRKQLAEVAVVHGEEAFPRVAAVDRTFELPTALYVATVGLFMAYLATMTLGFGNPGLILPMAIFVLFILAAFGVPAIWATMKPENTSRALSWGRFLSDGVQTETGPLDARAAAVQVLILPALILVWGIAVVTIAAVVR